MKCPSCGAPDTAVADSRLYDDGNSIKRRRICQVCGAKFTTLEREMKREIIVIKKNGSRDIFNREKLFNSILVCSGKRLINEQIDEIATNICNRVENSGASEVKTSLIAEMVMDNLERIDKIAYIRFASVHMNFETLEDVNNFIKNIAK